MAQTIVDKDNAELTQRSAMTLVIELGNSSIASLKWRDETSTVD
jgi:hypothetical protein